MKKAEKNSVLYFYLNIEHTHNIKTYESKNGFFDLDTFLWSS